MDKDPTRTLTISLVLTIFLIVFIMIRELDIISIQKIQDFISGFEILSPFIFIIIYILLSLIGVSTSIFAIIAGTVFGIWLGWLLVVVSAFISASLAFFISRKFKKDFAQRIRSKNLISRLMRRIEKESEKKGFITILILRMSLLPYIPLSYAAGLVPKLKWKDFALATFLTNIVGSFFFILFGYSLTKSIPLIIVAFTFVLLLTQIPNIIRKIRKY